MPKGKKHPSIQFDKIKWDLDEMNIKNDSYVDHDWDSQPELLLYQTKLSDFFNIIYDLDNLYGNLWDGCQDNDKLEKIIEEWNECKKLSPINVVPRDKNTAIIYSGNHRFTVLYNAYKNGQLQQKEIFFLIPPKSKICNENDNSKEDIIDCLNWIKNLNIGAVLVKTIKK